MHLFILFLCGYDLIYVASLNFVTVDMTEIVFSEIINYPREIPPTSAGYRTVII
jgi:hypothetical protein